MLEGDPELTSIVCKSVCPPPVTVSRRGEVTCACVVVCIPLPRVDPARSPERPARELGSVRTWRRGSVSRAYTDDRPVIGYASL